MSNMRQKFKHQEISRQLHADIVAGRYGVNQRLPSESQLVKKFGVSRPTVARALRELEAKGLIKRRVGAGSYVQSPNPDAIASRMLGLLVPGLATTEIFQVICGEIASLARVNDYGLLWGGSANPREDTRAGLHHAEALCQQFIKRKLSGSFSLRPN